LMKYTNISIYFLVAWMFVKGIRQETTRTHELVGLRT
jgi:hypothetical protein